jgi:hypothetical protein
MKLVSVIMRFTYTSMNLIATYRPHSVQHRLVQLQVWLDVHPLPEFFPCWWLLVCAGF